MFKSRQLIILMTVSLSLALNFDWDCEKSAATCNNACFAMNCKGSPGLLNYDSNGENRRPRRTAAGCKPTPCTDGTYSKYGNSCDEYPFASTAQGGTGAILRCVDSSENSSQGGQLRGFYPQLANGEQFGIAMKNIDKAPFCAKPKNCVNDGGEFMLNKNGLYVNARRSDQSRLFVPADPDSNEGTAFRKFMGSDGQQRMWLSKNTTGTLVGQYVWDGVGEKVLITSEIFS